jgi:hypothetical protein
MRRTVLRQLRAEDAFAPGADAVGLLLLRCYRTLSLVLIGLGSCIAVWSRSIDSVEEGLTTAEGILHALVTPLAALALGIAVRISVTPLAWGTACIFAWVTNSEMTPPPRRNTWWNRLMDQTRMASAYRALRWTTSVRDAAVASLGRTGQVLLYTDLTLRVLAALTVVVFVVSVGLDSG